MVPPHSSDGERVYQTVPSWTKHSSYSLRNLGSRLSPDEQWMPKIWNSLLLCQKISVPAKRLTEERSASTCFRTLVLQTLTASLDVSYPTAYWMACLHGMQYIFFPVCATFNLLLNGEYRSLSFQHLHHPLTAYITPIRISILLYFHVFLHRYLDMKYWTGSFLHNLTAWRQDV